MKTFGQELRDRRVSLGLLQSEVAKRAGVSTSYISTLEREQPHSITGARLRAEPDKVRAIAKAVEWDADAALLLAGYAPTKVPRKPTNLPELIEALEALGLPIPQFHGGIEGLLDEDSYEEALDRIRMDLELVLRRIESGRKRPKVEVLQGEIRTLEEENARDRKTGSD